jgi:hypothetical protein
MDFFRPQDGLFGGIFRLSATRVQWENNSSVSRYSGRLFVSKLRPKFQGIFRRIGQQQGDGEFSKYH